MTTIRAPGNFANSQLNGSEVVVVYDPGSQHDGVTVLLLSGPHAGREWQILRSHLSEG